MKRHLKTAARWLRSGTTQLLGPRRLRRLAATGQAPIPVLFYHRVAAERPNDWTISPQRFEQQIDFLRASFEVIALDEVQRRIRHSDSRRPAVAITFDDGYAENCDFALPLLIRHQLPCTYFVTVEHVLTGRPFPHDVAAGVPLPVNRVDQLRAMADAGIEIGLHTRTHIDFSETSDPQTIDREIVQATAELSEIVGHPIRYFAFPYGMPEQLTEAAIEAVDRAGLAGFCSAFGAYNVPGRDAFHIRRVHGDADFARFRNWMHFDRQKLRREPSISYHLPPGDGPPGEGRHAPAPPIPADAIRATIASAVSAVEK